MKYIFVTRNHYSLIQINIDILVLRDPSRKICIANVHNSLRRITLRNVRVDYSVDVARERERDNHTTRNLAKNFLHSSYRWIFTHTPYDACARVRLQKKCTVHSH